MRHEDEKSYDEDVSGYMHALSQELIFDLLELRTLSKRIED
jgi:hypothetical protein